MVRIYENMKAKEAAAIFSTLGLDILVQVLSNMTERKASIIAKKIRARKDRYNHARGREKVADIKLRKFVFNHQGFV